MALAAASLILLAALLLQAPIAQFPGYHDLADQRPLLGIPHFWNIASNLPFLLVGAAGLALLRRRPAGASPDALSAATACRGFAPLCSRRIAPPVAPRAAPTR